MQEQHKNKRLNATERKGVVHTSAAAGAQVHALGQPKTVAVASRKVADAASRWQQVPVKRIDEPRYPHRA